MMSGLASVTIGVQESTECGSSWRIELRGPSLRVGLADFPFPVLRPVGGSSTQSDEIPLMSFIKVSPNQAFLINLAA